MDCVSIAVEDLTAGPNIKVLVVDDESDIRELLVDELNDAGYKTIQAEDGAAALDMVHSHRPDIVLLDMMMPELDGLQVLNILRSDPETANLPVILVTATPAAQGELAAKALGVNHYVTKPWEPGVIQTVIRVTLREAGRAEQVDTADKADRPDNGVATVDSAEASATPSVETEKKVEDPAFY